jgi:hypothetical protein
MVKAGLTAATVCGLAVLPTSATAAAPTPIYHLVCENGMEYDISTPGRGALVEGSTQVAVLKGFDGTYFTGVPQDKLVDCETYDLETGEFLFTAHVLFTPQGS